GAQNLIAFILAHYFRLGSLLSLVFVCLVCFVVFNERSVRVPLWGVTETTKHTKHTKTRKKNQSDPSFACRWKGLQAGAQNLIAFILAHYFRLGSLLSLVFVCLVCFVVFNERSVRVPL